MASFKYKVDYSRDIKLVCTLIGSPKSICWYRNSLDNTTERIVIDRSKYKGSTLDDPSLGPSLEIVNVNENDTGSYFCTATFSGNEELRGDTVSVIIQGIKIEKQNYEVDCGKTVILECVLIGISNSKAVCWHKIKDITKTDDIIIDGSKYMGSNVTNPSLVIVNVNENDTGFYFCTAKVEDRELTGEMVYVSVQATFSGNEELRGDTVSVLVQGIKIAKENYEVDSGKTVTLECVLIGISSSEAVCWHRIKENNTMGDIIIDGSKYKGSSVTNPSLVIIDVNENDSGLYCCTAKVDDRELTGDKISVSVQGIKMKSLNYKVDYFSAVKLVCTIIGGPSLKSISWYRTSLNNNTKSIVIDGSKYKRSTIKDPSLEIVNVNENDAGFYICEAMFSRHNKLRGDAVSVIVQGIKIVKDNYEVDCGKAVTLECVLIGISNSKTVRWHRIKKNNKMDDIIIDGSKYMGSSVTNPSLIISDVNENDSGFYFCTAKVEDRELTGKRVSVSVQGTLSVLVSKTSYTVQMHGSVTLKCSITGNPHVVYWVKDNDRIKCITAVKNSRTTQNDHFLKIDDVDDSDDGVYKCIAENYDSEKQSEEINVSVIGGIFTMFTTVILILNNFQVK
ncbi:cell adhesion molecule CEACAM5-like [Mytilus edulis]|uniref:cell adhesion molecule CEACAM5-like n=1 Tax=Mytilus edulis TaxID=6550 RepID=UPI0039EE4DD3